MELISPQSIKKAYIEVLGKDKKYTNVLKKLLQKNETEPIFSFENLNYEDTPMHEDEQRTLLEVSMDLNSVNNGFIEIKNRINKLVNYIDTSLENVKESRKKEDERVSDINTICGQNSDFNMVIPIYAADFGQNGFEVINDKYIGGYVLTKTEVEFEVIDVSGNGIVGNKFVYNNDEFENEENDHSKIDYITDDNDITRFEYSRYITTDKKEIIDGIINYDQKSVELVLTLLSGTKVNKIEWLTETKDLIITKLETSNDGLEFTSQLKKPIKTQDTKKIYNDSGFIYGADILCFPYSYYVRITFSSSITENDKIAVTNDDGNVILYPNALREKIAINNIKLYGTTYDDITIESDNIITGGSVDKAGLFVSEYIPDHFTDGDYIKYYLIINGTEHEVVPVNSGKDGIKIIKFSKDSSSENNTYINTISESIKSAKIKIAISKASDKESPYIGNIKLCLGKETESIYV